MGLIDIVMVGVEFVLGIIPKAGEFSVAALAAAAAIPLLIAACNASLTDAPPRKWILGAGPDKGVVEVSGGNEGRGNEGGDVGGGGGCG